MKITFKQTSGACPEQYDALDEKGNTIGYLRLRHGHFTVEHPDVHGEVVYEAKTKGDGMFTEDERDFYLNQARERLSELL